MEEAENRHVCGKSKTLISSQFDLLQESMHEASEFNWIYSP